MYVHIIHLCKQNYMKLWTIYGHMQFLENLVAYSTKILENLIAYSTKFLENLIAYSTKYAETLCIFAKRV